MPWHARLHPVHPVVETVYSGMLTPAELAEAIRETLALVKSSGRTRLLGDCRNLEGGHGVVDLFRQASDGMAQSPVGLCEAVLMPLADGPGDAAQNVQFWETAAGNRGLRVRLFRDEAAAIQWLSSIS